MKKYFLAGLLLFTASFLFAQAKIDDIINAKEVERIERTLSSDDMRGRKAFTPDIDKPADFISDEFKKIGLQTFNNSKTYKQEFAMIQPRLISLSVTLDGKSVSEKNIIVVTCQPELKIDQSSGYEITTINAGGSLSRQANSFVQANKNVVVMVDESYAANFSRLAFLKRSLFKTDKNIIFILGNSTPKLFQLKQSMKLQNNL